MQSFFKTKYGFNLCILLGVIVILSFNMKKNIFKQYTDIH
jgi:hypothetical protein